MIPFLILLSSSLRQYEHLVLKNPFTFYDGLISTAPLFSNVILESQKDEHYGGILLAFNVDKSRRMTLLAQ